MKPYAYYPGCSLEKNAYAYHQSSEAVANSLGIEFVEVDDWNCCGATEYIALNRMAAYALVARTLALAQRQFVKNGSPADLIAPCSACFLNLSKGDAYLQADKPLAEKVNVALAEGDLHYDPGSIHTRHLMHVLMDDIGLEKIAAKVTRPLKGLRVAAYYGCLIVRPGFLMKFDSHEYPMSLDMLMSSLGAQVVDYPLKSACCGGHMTQISQPVALEMLRQLLQNAYEYHADVIVTLCPMCQLNLDAYQGDVNKFFKTDYNLPILYFTQLMGLAFGMDAKRMGIGSEFVDARPALAKIGVELPPDEDDKPKKPSKSALPMPKL